MNWWITAPIFFAAWALFTILPAGPKAIEAERSGVPQDQRSGVSIFPAFPLFPIVACILWAIWPPIVASILFWLHVALLAISLLLIAYYIVKLQKMRQRGQWVETKKSNDG